MTQPFGVAELQRLPDGRKPKGLAGVDGDVAVVALDQLEGVHVARRRVARLGPRDVEADDALVAVAHRQLGDLAAVGGVAHGGDQHADGDAEVGHAPVEAADGGLHHRVERQPAVQVLLGGEAALGVHDAIGCQVLGALVGDALQGLGGLHHPDGVREPLQVQLQRLAVSPPGEPHRQLLRVAGRQARIALLGRQIGDGGGAQPAVQVVVQQHLGSGADRLGRRRGRGRGLGVGHARIMPHALPLGGGRVDL